MHYICKGGCKGDSKEPGVCQAEDCSSKGHELEECNCEDGMHGGAFEQEAQPENQTE